MKLLIIIINLSIHSFTYVGLYFTVNILKLSTTCGHHEAKFKNMAALVTKIYSYCFRLK